MTRSPDFWRRCDLSLPDEGIDEWLDSLRGTASADDYGGPYINKDALHNRTHPGPYGICDHIAMRHHMHDDSAYRISLLQEDKPMSKPLAHSYSSIKQFENCPKQYNMQRVTKEVKATYGVEADWGNEIHVDLEKRLKGEAPLPERSVKYEELCKAFETGGGELLVEQEMTLNAQLEPTGWWDADAWLRSKVDVLVLNGPDALVADWKTGKHRPDFSQLELFAIQTFKHYPEVQRVKVSFVWLKDMKLDSETYKREQEPALWNTLITKIRRIEAALKANVWPAKPSGLCPWCPAKHICEFARV